MTNRQPQTHALEKLKGRQVWFFSLTQTNNGSRQGTVKRVYATKARGLSGVRVQLACGRRLRVSAYELTMTNHPTGVFWRGKLRPLVEWLHPGTKLDRHLPKWA